MCNSDEEYYETALRLIEDKQSRSDALGGRSRQDILESLFTEQGTADETMLRDILWAVYKNHESLCSEDKRCFSHSELI